MNYGNQLSLFTSVYIYLHKNPVFIRFEVLSECELWKLVIFVYFCLCMFAKTGIPSLLESWIAFDKLWDVPGELWEFAKTGKIEASFDSWWVPWAKHRLSLFLSISNFAKVLTGDEFHGRETGQSMDSSCFSTSNFMQIGWKCGAETPALRFCDEW